ncbi:low molecular weight protein-tyrosine-phosphatase [Aidingimonas halophila]|uniref:protein-tyrosine-phosphatase n=1 Tax=Aidingimonas halophila TaxID=574349 RepID=A0A1H3CIB4_9GAMM|nr:low molecular weight protein-tyrosine-phosphatase [Aidingimonas halophila]SDX53891.1 protein-tyrosine phosphatase [Aidingimonas halophila]
MFDSILVVCSGNLCRSPVATALLQVRLPGRVIRSAGLSANLQEGLGVASTARELAEADGLNVQHHRSRSLRREWLENVDLVLVMTESQRLAIGDMAPEATGRTFLFGRWLEGGGPQGVEIPDPYRKSRESYIHVHRLLVNAADEWQRKITL